MPLPTQCSRAQIKGYHNFLPHFNACSFPFLFLSPTKSPLYLHHVSWQQKVRNTLLHSVFVSTAPAHQLALLHACLEKYTVEVLRCLAGCLLCGSSCGGRSVGCVERRAGGINEVGGRWRGFGESRETELSEDVSDCSLPIEPKSLRLLSSFALAVRPPSR
jgi:hypothetical protein